MKKYCYLLVTTLFIGSFTRLSAQDKLSANVYTGWLLPYNDYTEADFTGIKPNLAVGAAIGYDLAPFFRLRGDLMYGSMNGNNNLAYYEANILEPQIGFDLNIIRFFNPEFTKVKLNMQGGMGMLFYNSRLYDINTRQKIAESPVPSERSLSPNGFFTYGANIGIALSPKLDLNLGMTNRYVLDAPWLDVTQSGEYTDHYGLAQIGFTFYLKSDKDPGNIEIEKKRYNSLLARMDSLEATDRSNTADQEKLAQLEMEQQEKNMRIRILEAQNDSLKNRLANPRTDMSTTRQPGQEYAPADADAILGAPAYRIIVASLPARAMAQRWIDRSSLDKSEMVIAYIENLNTYRVVYKSFDSYAAARKELLNIKPQVSDAWIIKF